MCNNSIWPERTIPVGRAGYTGYSTSTEELWLDDDKVAQVLSIVAWQPPGNLIEKPVLLDSDNNSRLLALVVLGSNGVSGGVLLLGVANERTNNRPVIRLSIFESSLKGGSKPGLMPDGAGDALDRLAEQIYAAVGFTPPRGL